MPISSNRVPARRPSDQYQELAYQLAHRGVSNDEILRQIQQMERARTEQMSRVSTQTVTVSPAMWEEMRGLRMVSWDETAPEPELAEPEAVDPSWIVTNPYENSIISDSGPISEAMYIKQQLKAEAADFAQFMNSGTTNVMRMLVNEKGTLSVAGMYEIVVRITGDTIKLHKEHGKHLKKLVKSLAAREHLRVLEVDDLRGRKLRAISYWHWEHGPGVDDTELVSVTQPRTIPARDEERDAVRESVGLWTASFNSLGDIPY